jgi:hypothetical protein
MRLDEGWELIYVQTFYRESVGYPVEPIYIPGIFSNPIRVHISSATARKSWRVAGELVQLVGDSHRAADIEGETLTLPLNAIRLISFSSVTTEYSLKFYPKPWIDSFEIQVDKLPSS